MYIDAGQMVFSPSDLTLYMDGSFASKMEHLALLDPSVLSLSDEADEMMALLQDKMPSMNRVKSCLIGKNNDIKLNLKRKRARNLYQYQN